MLKRITPYLILVCGLLLLCASDLYLAGYTFGVRSITVRVANIQQVMPIADPYVRPVLYTHIDGLASLPTAKAKETFVHAVLPAILVAKHEMAMLRLQLQKLDSRGIWNHDDSILFHTASQRFRTTSVHELLQRVVTLPNSVVLAQAAVESGWGQSRIFLEGNNLFGIWSFNANEPRIAAGETRGKKTIWLRSYNNMSESIMSYFEILATSAAFKSLRSARTETSDPIALLPYLKNFSERRHAYTRQLKTMIEQNDFEKYDEYTLDPEYLYEK